VGDCGRLGRDGCVSRPVRAQPGREGYIGLSIFKNGKLMDSATGSTVFGNPVHAVVWLANKMYELGSPLRKGEVIMSGSFTPVFPIGKGDYVEAVFDRLGRVSVFGQ